MNKEIELSPNDKRLLENFDISMFKSAVAYLQNSRHNSCDPSTVPDLKYVNNSKYRTFREKEPPLLPIESKRAILSKKYVNDSQIMHKNLRNDVKLQKIEGDGVNVLNIDGKSPIKIRFGANEFISNDSIRFSSQIRRSSVASNKEEEKGIRLLYIQNKILDYERNKNSKNHQIFNEILL